MPFEMLDAEQEIKNQLDQDETLKEEYDKSRPEYEWLAKLNEFRNKH